jgi:hypothetical protein
MPIGVVHERGDGVTEVAAIKDEQPVESFGANDAPCQGSDSASAFLGNIRSRDERCTL